MRNTVVSMSLAELQERQPPRRRGLTPQPERECTFCCTYFSPRPKIQPTRNWCYRPGCEALAESVKRHRLREQQRASG